MHDGVARLDISVVIPTFNRPPLLGEALDSLAGSDIRPSTTLVVVVVDNDKWLDQPAV